MKFNIQLKEELNRYEKKLATESISTTAAICEADEKPQPPKLRDRPSEKVVGGDILWKPIDRAAAMLLAKAPWWAQPPQVSTPKIEQPQPKPRKEKRMSQIKTAGYAPPGVNPDALVIEEKSGDQLNHEISKEFVKRTSKTLDQSGELVEKAMDARAAMDVMCETWKASWMDFQETSDARLKELRMTRIAMDSEMRQLMASLREVRAFFLDKDYATEIARLKDFVETCERLQKLKDSGFLDSVADTMLRLAERQAV